MFMGSRWFVATFIATAVYLGIISHSFNICDGLLQPRTTQRYIARSHQKSSHLYSSVSKVDVTIPSRLKKARLRLAEAQGLIPFGASDSPDQFKLNDLSSLPQQSASKVKEISWRVAEPAIKYDPLTASNKFFKQPLKWLARNIQIFVPLGLFSIQLLLDIIRGEEENNRKERAEELLQIISAQSPALIKAGQALASRSDLLPKEYLESLQQLQDRCPAYPTEQAMQLFQDEFNRDLNEVFSLDFSDPIAAASIGQVYKATLRSNGAKVAIKIQRPNCEDLIAIDLFVLRWYAQFFQNVLKLLKRNIDLVSVIDDFGDLIYREIDYNAEAVNAQRFSELYSDIKDIFVPKVYPQWTSTKILTMEWVDGCRLTNTKELKSMDLDSSKLVDILVECSLRQMLSNGLFHADPHGGNLLALPSGKLCYLDFGMVSYVEASQRYSIIEAVVHLVNRDFVSLTELYRRMGFIPQDVDAAPIINALQDALPDVLNAPVGQLNFKNVISKLGDVMFNFPFSLPPFYIAIIRCLGVLEGVAIEVDKDFRIINRAYPYIASRLLSDPSSELQSASQQLLLRNGLPRWDRLEELLEVAGESNDYDVIEALDLVYSYVINPGNKLLRQNIVEQTVDLIDSASLSTIQSGPVALQGFLSSLWTKGPPISVLPELLTGLTSFSLRPESIMNDVTKQSLTSLSQLMNEQMDVQSSGSHGQAMKTVARIVKIMANKEDLDISRLTATFMKMGKHPLVKDMVNQVISEGAERTAQRFIGRIPLAN